MRSILVYSLLVLMMATVGGCCKRKQYCDFQELNILIIGFDRGASRSIIVKRYAQWDNARTKALDSTQYIYNGTAPVVPGRPDTLRFSDYTPTSGPQNRIKAGNDWVLTLPAVNYRYHISDIRDDGHHSEIVRCNDDETKCTKGISSFNVNGNQWGGSNFYISK